MSRAKKTDSKDKISQKTELKPHKDGGLWDVVSKSVTPIEGRERLYSQHLEQFLEAHEEAFEASHLPKKRKPQSKSAQKTLAAKQKSVLQKTTAAPDTSSFKTNLKTNLLGMLEHGDSPGVDRRTAQRLKRGKMQIDAKLDLHGFGLEQAHVRLNSFIQSAHAQGNRCILVVTGKGEKNMGAIKQSVPRWLNEAPLRDKILSFSFAQIEDGGKGALYVLLKRKRDYK